MDEKVKNKRGMRVLSIYLIDSQGVTKMFRSFIPNTVERKIECNECL